MRQMSRTGKAAIAVLALVVFFSTFISTAAAASETEQFFADMFLPEGVHTAGPQEFFFMIAAFMFMLALLFYGTKQVIDSTPEALIIALSISLFIIPSGGYKLLTGVLMGIFGLGNVELGSGSAGSMSVEAQYVKNIIAMTKDNDVLRGAITLAVGGFMAIFLGSGKFGSKDGIQWTEGVIIVLFMSATWLFLGGAEILYIMLGLVFIVSVGVAMIGVAGKRGGLLGNLVGIFGIVVVGYGLTLYQDALPAGLQPIAEFGSLLINAVGAFLLAVIAVITMAGFIFFAHANNR